MTRRATLALAGAAAAVVVAAAAGCEKEGAKEGAGAGAGGGKGGGALAAHVAAVNAAIPADLKGKLEFEAGRIVENERQGRVFLLAVPKGWKKDRFLEGGLEPPDADMIGSKTLGRTRMSVGRNCDGKCVKKDWAAVSDQVHYSQFTSGKAPGKILKDEKRPSGRTLVFERALSKFPDKDVAVHIHTSWWEPDAPEYFTCSADVGVPLKGAAEAFEKACALVIKE